MNSIRRQLVLWLLGLLLVAGTAAAAGLYLKIRDEANQLFDYHLEQLAYSLRDQVLALGEPSLSDELQYELVIQIWGPNGDRIYLSHPNSALPNRAQMGFQSISTPDGGWRVFSVQLRDRTIQVAQPLAVRQTLARRLALRTVLPFALLLPLLGVLVWIIVGRGLRPLDRVATELEKRTPSALEPLADKGLPGEVRPLVLALNDLLGRLAHSIAAQRAFVADAAHELRSPLTAVQLQARIAERATTDGERGAALAQLKEGVGRAVHMVQQLLTLARQEPDVAPRPFARVDLGRVARQVIAEQAPLAAARRIDLGLSQDDPAAVMGDEEALRTLLTNLVDNAVRYIPEGGKVDVSVAHEGGRPLLTVADNGPGIPAEERERVLDRFYRRAGSGAGGTGLGLAIVKNVADRHGAELVLSDADGAAGLRITVRFPAA
jgi:two-component system OmpR family sensor kinase